ncbi:hypothetical protein P4H66_17175 [Paenibacillus dokdonensis]|uniref:Uncharacterized protein n=1 Tax=Paenibacillus dokdonensis TaxID=2567944 RepID=A0ABU6GTQ7_9BACL|nr:hypothetical protein [Paenibacillus dokdonensis]MEC0241552.1 hypothetical protein [Paenibacillus dokdonensis]
MGFLKSIWRFFVPRERTLIFTSFQQDDYARVKNRLQQSGISHRSRIVNWDGGRGFSHTRRMQYSIYVDKADENSAVEAAGSK